MILLLYLFINVVMCFVVAGMGSERKVGSSAAFIISFIFSFPIGLLFVMASDKKEKPAVSQAPVLKLTEREIFEVDKKNKEAIDLYTSGQYKESLKVTEEILLISPNNPYALANASRVCSILRDKNGAFTYLQRVVEANHPSINKLLESSDFDYIKSLPDYNEFIRNGFKKPFEPSPPVFKVSLADELEKLAALKDKGILTEEEFQAQKGKLLST